MALVLVACLGWAGLAGATLDNWIMGKDSGAAIAGPWPNASTAESVFLMAAAGYGPVSTIAFEKMAVGFYTPSSLRRASKWSSAPRITAMVIRE